MLVAVNNLQGYVHQLYLERDVGLVSLADNPLVAVDVHDSNRGTGTLLQARCYMSRNLTIDEP